MDALQREQFKFKRIEDFQDKIQKVFNFLSLDGKFDVIGSAILKGNLYSADYDLQEIETINNPNELYKHFKDKFATARQDPNVIITDFKCGEYKGEPLRWNERDITRGYVVVDGRQIPFTKAILMTATIKIDVVVYMNGSFLEFSENYYLKIGDKTNYDPASFKAENILESIEKDLLKYLKEGNLYKALKRFFSILFLQNKLKPTAQRNSILHTILDFFNSETGILYKAKSSIETIILILINENGFRKPKIENVRDALQQIKQNLSVVANQDVNNEMTAIDKITTLKGEKEMIKSLENLSKKLLNLINIETSKFISFIHLKKR